MRTVSEFSINKISIYCKRDSNLFSFAGDVIFQKGDYQKTIKFNSLDNEQEVPESLFEDIQAIATLIDEENIILANETYIFEMQSEDDKKFKVSSRILDEKRNLNHGKSFSEEKQGLLMDKKFSSQELSIAPDPVGSAVAAARAIAELRDLSPTPPRAASPRGGATGASFRARYRKAESSSGMDL